MINFINKNKYYFILIALVLIGIIAYVSRDSSDEGLTKITAERLDLTQQVSVTGRVVPAQEANLAFQRGGRVAVVYKKIGDSVNRHDLIARLYNSDLYSQVQEAEAGLLIEQARLDELANGARPEDLAVQEANLEQSEQDFSNLYLEAIIKLNDAFNKSDEAVRSKTSAIFSGSASGSFQLTFQACNLVGESRATNLRLSSDRFLDEWQSQLSQLHDSHQRVQLEQALVSGRDRLVVFSDFLREISNVLSSGCARNNPQLDSHRAGVSAARPLVDNAIGSLIGVEQSLASQKSLINKLEKDLALTRSGTRPEQIAAQEARVAQAAARLQNTRAILETTYIRSPFSGLITRQDAKVEEVVSVGSVLTSIISRSNFEIESSIPEVDIAKIKIGDPAAVTLDAYAEKIFAARVSKIEPAGVVIDGVATYKVTLQFIEASNLIRSGMTANIDITTDSRDDVVVIPQRAVLDKDGKSVVRVSDLKTNQVKEVQVETGLKGSDGNIEIKKGLTAGAIIVF